MEYHGNPGSDHVHDATGTKKRTGCLGLDVEPVFSMANLTRPGSFDKNAWNTMEIRGVTMFMTLPGPRNALDAWDSMLATSRRLAELLHADLLDDQHEVFTRQRSLQIKEELREYERQKNPES